MTRARDLAAFVSNADGDIKFDTDTLFIDSSTNRVGIGTTTPDHSLSISSAATTQAELKTTATNGTAQLRYTNDARTYTQGVDNNDKFFLYDATGAANRLIVDTSGNVGIGDTSPESNNNYTALTVTSTSGSGGGQVYTQSSTVSSVFGSDNAGSGPKSILQTVTNHPLVLGTNNTERLRVTNDGLTFNGDTAAANALGDYEFGTCTLTTLSSVANASGVAHEYARYVKIGNLVTIQGRFNNINYSSGRVAFTAHVPFAMVANADIGQIGTCSSYPYSKDESTGYILDNTGGNDTQIYFELQVDTAVTGAAVSYNLVYTAA